MQLIPAIDIKDGKCVRLTQGDIEKLDVFSLEPVDTAKKWEDMGASIIHVVDLDGAFTGKTKNMEVIEDIINAVQVPIQLGGGIRELNTIDKYFNMGVNRVVIGTAAVKNPQLVQDAVAKYQDRIVIGIDARNEKVSVEGWVETSEISCYELAKKMESLGVKRIVFTDVSKDGMMQGPNIKSIRRMLKETSLKVIASGGVSCLNDLKNLKNISERNLEGVIIGKALYTNKIDFKAALKLLKKVGD